MTASHLNVTRTRKTQLDLTWSAGAGFLWVVSYPGLWIDRSCLSLTRANSDLDVRQNLQAALSWTDRKRSANWATRNLLGGWGVDGRVNARSAFPVTPLGNLFSDPATGNRYYSGVDMIAGRPVYLYGSTYPGGRMFNGGPDADNPAFV
jgi:hypothetical protein